MEVSRVFSSYTRILPKNCCFSLKTKGELKKLPTKFRGVGGYSIDYGTEYAETRACRNEAQGSGLTKVRNWLTYDVDQLGFTCSIQ